VTYLNSPENSRRRLLRLKDAAIYLSLSPWKLRRLIWEGRLPVVQDCEGSPFLFDRHDLDSYVESHKRNFPL
jgi:excisionase family DNA binding protein